MKLDAPVNQNYCATVVEIKTLVPLANADNLMAIPMFGMQAIVDKSYYVGQVGILIPAECQLSEEFTQANNLFRHEYLNLDPTKKGYLEDNRRVQAIKLRGHRSDALFMPLDSLLFAYEKDGLTMHPAEELTALLLDNIGMQFDHIPGLNGSVEICHKYERPIRLARGLQAVTIKNTRVDKRYMPEHFDSPNVFRVQDSLDPNAQVVVTQKLHGTSIRVANTIVQRKLTMFERLVKRFGAKVQETEFDYVFGSRKVIKDANNPNQQHFYDEDIWTREGKKLAGLIPQNYIVYGELIGWTGGLDGVTVTGDNKSGTIKGNYAPIQSHYTYDCLPGTCKLYVYRVAFVNAQGTVADLSWDAVKEFCTATGLNHVPEMWRGTLGVATTLLQFRGLWLDMNFHALHEQTGDKMFRNVVPLSADSPCDEGVCIRIEGIIPQIYKAKSPLFLQHETSMLNSETAVDVEAEATGEAASV